MEEEPKTMKCTLEELNNPETRALYEEKNSIKDLQRNLTEALEEARESIDCLKGVSDACTQEFSTLKDGKEKDIGQFNPFFLAELSKLTDYFRSEMVAQNSENMKFNKQVQSLVKEKNIIQQLTSESIGKIAKNEASLQIT